MARASFDLGKILITGVVGFGAYNLGLNGTFGTTFQRWMEQLQEQINAGGGGDTVITPGPGGTTWPKCGGPFAPSGPMAEANPNFETQMAVWQGLRRTRAENPYSWQDFRLHLGGLNAPDPGSRPPQIFCGISFKPS